MRFLTRFAVAGSLLFATSAWAQTVQSISLTANQMLYEPVSGKLYATVPSRAGSNGNSIATIDPVTATVLSTVFIGSEPDPLAASDDGQFLYIGLDGASAVRRYTIATQRPGLQFSLGSDPFFGAYHAGDIKVLPKQPHSIAVSRNFSNVSPANNGVAIYDDAVQRPNVVTRQTGGLLDSLAFSASASVLYAQDEEDSAGTLATLAVDANGVTYTGGVNDIWGEFGGPIVFDANTERIFDTNGEAADPQALALTGRFTQAYSAYNYYGTSGGVISSIAPDTANGRVFFLIYDQFHQDSTVTVAAFDPMTFMPIGTLIIPNVLTPSDFTSSAGDLVLWGTDGLAFLTSSGQLWLVSGRSFPGLAKFQLSASKVVGGATVTGTVTLSQPAPSWGATVKLASSNAGLVSLPAGVTVAPGQTSATFQVATSSGTQDVSVTASYGTQSIVRSLLVTSSAATGVYPTNVRVVHLATDDLAFDPVGKRIYASVPSSVVGIGNSITEISPTTANIGSSVFIGSEPFRLAVSGDGEFLYSGLYGAASIRRFDLSTQMADLQFALGNGGWAGPMYPGKLVVLPGEPHALAVSRYFPWLSPSFAGLAVYDDGVERPNVYSGFTGGETITAGATAGRLYGFDNETTLFELDRFNVDADGVTLLDSTGNLISGFGADITYQGGMIFATTGQVINAERRTQAGTFSGLSGLVLVAPDVTHRKVYFLQNDNSGNTILRLFDPRTFLEIADFALPGVQGSPSSLFVWKADNLAFRTSAGQVFLVNASLPALANVSVAPSKLVGGAGATGKVQLSNVATSAGITVNLVSSNPSIVSVPTSVSVAPGTQSATFAVQTSSVSTATKVTITANYLSINKSVTITVNP
jgi:hypothetical protein